MLSNLLGSERRVDNKQLQSVSITSLILELFQPKYIKTCFIYWNTKRMFHYLKQSTNTSLVNLSLKCCIWHCYQNYYGFECEVLSSLSSGYFVQGPDWSNNGTMKIITPPAFFTHWRTAEFLAISPKCSVVVYLLSWWGTFVSKLPFGLSHYVSYYTTGQGPM